MSLAPVDEAGLAAAIAGAAANGTPLEITGGGTRKAMGRPVQAEATLSVAGLSGITLYEPGALTLVAKAGTPMADVESALAAEGQMLPFEPMDHRALLGSSGTPTIGGAVAVAASGPRRFQRGACRDSMIGVRFVDGAGAAISNGGRVMKNVTGYDLVKVMAGSWGTLGVLSEVAFKVLPAPQAETTVMARGFGLAEGLKTLTDVLQTPYEVTGAAYGPAGILDDASITALRVEGLEGSVNYRVEKLTRRGDWTRVNGTESRAFWTKIRDVTPFAGRDGAVWRVSLPAADAPGFGHALDEVGLEHQCLFDWAGGLIWVLCPSDGDAGAAAIRGAANGHATLVRAPAPVRAAVDVFQPQTPVIAQLSAGLREKFDPHGILNPGKMG